MKKTIFAIIILASMFALTISPMTRSSITTTMAPTHVYTVTPIHEQFEDAADFSSGSDPVGTYVPWDVDIVNAENYLDGGDGVYVAVLDTGLISSWASFVAPTAIIETSLGRGWSYDITWNTTKNDFDFVQNTNRGFITSTIGSGHGTHVTCEMVGYQRSTIGVAPHIVQGVAPKVHIIPLLGLDTWLVPTPDPTYYNPYWGTVNYGGYVLFRGGDTWMLVSAINYVASLADAHPNWKIIVNNSWGSSEPDPEIRAAVDNAINKGVIFVFSAGNDGEAGMGWPGAYPEMISAAAGGWTMENIGYPPSNPSSPYRWYLSDVPEKLNTFNDPLGVYGYPIQYANNWQIYLSDYSGRPNSTLGQSWMDLDVCAPGSYVVGPYQPEVFWNGATWVTSSPAYYGLWGTSMAAPHVSGVAAIVAQHNPSFNQTDMEWVLKKAASRIPMTSNTKYVVDNFAGPAFPCNDHDAGEGWLTVDNALRTASIYTG